MVECAGDAAAFRGDVAIPAGSPAIIREAGGDAIAGERCYPMRMRLAAGRIGEAADIALGQHVAQHVIGEAVFRGAVQRDAEPPVQFVVAVGLVQSVGDVVMRGQVAEHVPAQADVLQRGRGTDGRVGGITGLAAGRRVIAVNATGAVAIHRRQQMVLGIPLARLPDRLAAGAVLQRRDIAVAVPHRRRHRPARRGILVHPVVAVIGIAIAEGLAADHDLPGRRGAKQVTGAIIAVGRRRVCLVGAGLALI